MISSADAFSGNRAPNLVIKNKSMVMAEIFCSITFILLSGFVAANCYFQIFEQ
jgi:hypothetical protein